MPATMSAVSVNWLVSAFQPSQSDQVVTKPISLKVFGLVYKQMKIREWDRNRSFVRIRFHRPTSAQLSRAVKADEISVVEPTQPLRLARQSKDN